MKNTTENFDNDMQLAISAAGNLGKLAKYLNVSYQSIQRWLQLGRLPDTEYSRKTNYARNIVKLTKHKAKLRNLLPKL